MSAPRQTCKLCGNTWEISVHMGGFPPDTARRYLRRLCQAQGCPCDPEYTIGIAEEALNNA